MQTYTTQALINDTEVEYKLLAEVESIQAIGKFGMFREHPLNKTDTITFSRLNPFNMVAASGSPTVGGYPSIDPQDFMFQEGITPDANTISYTDVPATLQNYDVLFKYTSKTALMHEHKIPDDMIRQTGKVVAEIMEMVAYGQVKSGTSVCYANGSTRAGLDQPISLPICGLGSGR
jgi:N4-gp56 family major capsid protein